MIIALVLGVTFFVVFMERGQRRITVNYARRQGGRQAYMNQSSHLPLKLNMAGVIPPIFASSLIMFPATMSHLVQQPTPCTRPRAGAARSSAAADDSPRRSRPAEPLHMLLYGAMIIGFAFFYTALVFNSQETAENLKKSGALIPGIRPGKATADYIDGVLTRLTLIGALYLVLVCLLPGAAARRLQRTVLFRWYVAVDRGRGGDGFHRADPGPPDVASVRRPDEEGQFEGRLAVCRG